MNKLIDRGPVVIPYIIISFLEYIWGIWFGSYIRKMGPRCLLFIEAPTTPYNSDLGGMGSWIASGIWPWGCRDDAVEILAGTGWKLCWTWIKFSRRRKKNDKEKNKKEEEEKNNKKNEKPKKKKKTKTNIRDDDSHTNHNNDYRKNNHKKNHDKDSVWRRQDKQAQSLHGATNARPIQGRYQGTMGRILGHWRVWDFRHSSSYRAHSSRALEGSKSQEWAAAAR